MQSFPVENTPLCENPVRRLRQGHNFIGTRRKQVQVERLLRMFEAIAKTQET